jgi:hypothetical protein
MEIHGESFMSYRSSLWVGNLTADEKIQQCRCLPPSSEDGNKSTFRNVEFSSLFRIKDDWQSPKTSVILNVIHHGQNPLESVIMSLGRNNTRLNFIQIVWPPTSYRSFISNWIIIKQTHYYQLTGSNQSRNWKQFISTSAWLLDLVPWNVMLSSWTNFKWVSITELKARSLWWETTQ